MHTQPTPCQSAMSIELASGEVRRLRLNRGDSLVVNTGRLWMTRAGDDRDHVLCPAQGHVAAMPQEVLVQACGASACRFEQQRMRPAEPMAAIWQHAGAWFQRWRNGLKRRSSPKVLSGP